MAQPPLRYIFTIRAAYLLISCAFSCLPDYDTSNSLLELGPHVFRGLFTWDAVYFIHLAMTSLAYEFEHFFAFFPGFPCLLRSVSSLLAPFTSSATALGLAAVLVNFALSVVAGWYLYHVSQRVLASKSAALLSAILFALSPASVFLAAAYTEALFASLCFAGIWHWLERRPLIATALFTAAAAVRSNAILFCGFFLYDLTRVFFGQHSAAHRIRAVLQGLFCCAAVALPSIGMHVWANHLYCQEPRQAPWCEEHPYGIYHYIERKYWNVGFLRYYELKQLPNFAICFPVVALTARNLHSYVTLNGGWSLLRTLGHASEQHTGSCEFVFHAQLLGFVLVALLFMHVQVATRFLIPCPALYWAAAREVQAGGLRGKLVIFYFVFWGLLGCLMFTNFFPWT
eukprot:TRINITY_DN28708_c0_g1_i2.p1 TRINITY_DN28708_c0_g1~~TRINITY_DN28708_c0_g1_i2.p1  ORF type:complete len:399 (-),score=41.66 TRINITY_DN28708_c0_g1_i2:30-1226(-)